MKNSHMSPASTHSNIRATIVGTTCATMTMISLSICLLAGKDWHEAFCWPSEKKTWEVTT